MNGKKTLTTFVGGFIDKMSYGTIALCILGDILFCALYYWLLNPVGQGTNYAQLDWGDSLYYSVITFTSLGYGDIAPLGFGKAIASLQVLSGLLLTAIFVGKIASERQSAMLRLIYTSEHQRRLVEFQKDLDKLDDQLDDALTEHDQRCIDILSKSIYPFVASITSYLHFQANHGDLTTFGNVSALRRLYKSMAKIDATSYEAARTYGIQPNTKNRFDQIIFRVDFLVTTMIHFHTQDSKTSSLLREMMKTKINLLRWNQSIGTTQCKYASRTVLTNQLLVKVKENMPDAPWPKHVHKDVARALRITNKLAQKGIDKLIADGVITPQ